MKRLPKNLDVDKIKELKEYWLSPPYCWECTYKNNYTNLNVKLWYIFNEHKEYIVNLCEKHGGKGKCSWIDLARLLSEKEVFTFNIL